MPGSEERSLPPILGDVPREVIQVPSWLGGLNGPTHHQLEIHLQESQKLKLFANVDPMETLPCLGLIEYSQPDRFSRENIVGSTV
jgi:hypothetical protein